MPLPKPTSLANRFHALQLDDTDETQPSPAVDIHIDLQLPETKRTRTVQRHLSQENLARLPEVVSLQEAFNASAVKVSPASSANSETQVHVNASYHEIVTSIRTDLMDEIDRKIEERVSRRLKASMELQQKVTALIAMRNVQDLVIQKMCSDLGSSFEEFNSFADVVEEWSRVVGGGALTQDELTAIKETTSRRLANDYAHYQNLPAGEIDAMVEIMYIYLEENEGTQAARRYRRLFEWARLSG